jgi:hypothetical protein
MTIQFLMLRVSVKKDMREIIAHNALQIILGIVPETVYRIRKEKQRLLHGWLLHGYYMILTFQHHRRWRKMLLAKRTKSA